VALKEGEIRIVQSSMLGSILSNMLLVLGMCFVAGGIKNTRTGVAAGIEQTFNTTVAGTMSSLMIVASATLVIPATLYAVLADSKEDSNSTMLFLSRGTAIIMLILYLLYLFFQLKTHTGLFEAEKEAADIAHDGGENGQAESGPSGPQSPVQEDEEKEEKHMSPWAAAVILCAITVVVAICAEFLVDSIAGLTETAHISKTFVGLILLPIVGNAAEHVTAIVVAVKDKMDLALGVAMGSSLQIALFVTPLMVILGWIKTYHTPLQIIGSAIC